MNPPSQYAHSGNRVNTEPQCSVPQLLHLITMFPWHARGCRLPGTFHFDYVSGGKLNNTSHCLIDNIDDGFVQ